jgi:hypothetical protein
MDFNQWKVFLESVDGRVRTEGEVLYAMNFYNTHYDMNGNPIPKKARKRMVQIATIDNKGLSNEPKVIETPKPIVSEKNETPKPIVSEKSEPLIKVPIPSEIKDGVYTGKVENGMQIERSVNIRMYDVNEVMESPQFQHFMKSWNESSYGENWPKLKNKNPFLHFLDTKLIDVYFYVGVLGRLKNPESLEFVDGSEFSLIYDKEERDLTLHIPYKAQNGYGNYVVGKAYLIEDSNGENRLL